MSKFRAGDRVVSSAGDKSDGEFGVVYRADSDSYVIVDFGPGFNGWDDAPHHSAETLWAVDEGDLTLVTDTPAVPSADPELEAIRAVLVATDDLDYAELNRVVRYVIDRRPH